MAYLPDRGTSLVLQRKWPSLGIPRFSKATGATTQAHARLIAAAVDGVAKAAKGGNAGALRLLKALHHGNVSLPQLDAVMLNGLDAMLALLPAAPEPEKPADPADGPNDAEAFQEWLAEHDIKPQSRKSYTHQYNALMRHATPAQTRMRDLPDILDTMRRWCVRNDSHRTAFNRALAVCLAWVRGTRGLGKRHAIYLALGDLTRFPEKPKPKEHYTPRELQDVIQRLPDHIGPMLWFEACHGLGATEMLYDGYRRDGTHGLRVAGEKNEYRERTVPYVGPLLTTLGIKHLSGYHGWFKAITRDTRRRMTPHTLRACYSRWLEDAGIPGRRVRIYMGHAIASMTERYQAALVTRELADDAAKLRAWIDAELAAHPASEDVTPIVRDPGQGARRRAWKAAAQAA